MKKIILIMFMILALVGCTKQKEDDKKEPVKEEKPIVVPVKKLKIIDLDSKSRPIAIMINNHEKARPNHAGLQDAYIIYEIIVEGGYTRFMALYKDQTTERIGSARSSRHYFLDYAMENDAFYTHFGWSPQAKSDISTYKINNINFLSDAGSFRDKTLNVATEHTAFTTIKGIEETIAKKKYRTETNKENLFNYSVDPVVLPNGLDVLEFDFEYSTASKVKYTYDAANKVFKRQFNGVNHVDAVTKLDYTFKNIIITTARNTKIAGDSSGRQTIENIGTGNGYYISEGKYVPITWEKTSREAQTIYKYADGSEITLNDGNTFIQIIPKDKVVNFR